MPGRAMKFRDILDGLSNTIVMSETNASVAANAANTDCQACSRPGRNPSLCLRAAKNADTEFWDFGRGLHGAMEPCRLAWIPDPVLPPNSPFLHVRSGNARRRRSRPPARPRRRCTDRPVRRWTRQLHYRHNRCRRFDITSRASERHRGEWSRREKPLWSVGCVGNAQSKETIEEQLPNVAFAGQGAAASEKDRYLTWTDNKGEVSLSAKFVRIRSTRKRSCWKIKLAPCITFP